MALRILDGGRPGVAILEFDQAMSSPELDIAVRSLTSRPGLYVTADGSWEKSPTYFKATRISGDGNVTRYSVGPEVVNHVLDQDAVQVSIADQPQAFDTIWENATPELAGSARIGRIYPGGRPKPVPAAAPAPAAVEPQPAEIPVAATEQIESPAYSEPPPKRSRLPLLAGLLGAVALALWLLPGLRCTLFAGALGGCEDGTGAVLACLAQAKASNACMANQCLQGQSVDALPAPVQERVRTELADAQAKCVPPNPRDSLEAARACMDQKEKAADFCHLQDCLATVAADAGPAEQRAQLVSRARDGQSRCQNQEQAEQQDRAKDAAAADSARSCAAEQEKGGHVCDVASSCYEPYLKDHPKGQASAETARLAEEARAKCRTAEAHDSDALKDCADKQRQAGRICDFEQLCLGDRGSVPQAQVDKLKQQAADECRALRAQQNEDRRRQEDERRSRENAEADRRQIDDRFWAVAKACATASASSTGSAACNAKTCYEGYLTKFPSGDHVADAKAAIDATECRPTNQR
jgi:hypothetical protein